jgi:hypothetical protein
MLRGPAEGKELVVRTLTIAVPIVAGSVDLMQIDSRKGVGLT